MNELISKKLDMPTESIETLLEIESLTSRIIEAKGYERDDLIEAEWIDPFTGNQITLSKCLDVNADLVYMISSANVDANDGKNTEYAFNEEDCIPQRIDANDDVSPIQDRDELAMAISEVHGMLLVGDDHPDVPLRDDVSDQFWKIAAHDVLEDSHSRIAKVMGRKKYQKRIEELRDIEDEIMHLNPETSRLIARLALYNYIDYISRLHK